MDDWKTILKEKKVILNTNICEN